MNNRTKGQQNKPKKGYTPKYPYQELTAENYVDLAERAILDSVSLKNEENEKKLSPTQIEEILGGGDIPNGYQLKLTTTQIRNTLSMVMNFYNEVVRCPEESFSEKYKESIQYLRLRIAYEAGRRPEVKDFVTESHLLEHVKNIKDKKDFLLFAKYMEALVAYHKFYGGRDFGKEN